MLGTNCRLSGGQDEVVGADWTHDEVVGTAWAHNEVVGTAWTPHDVLVAGCRQQVVGTDWTHDEVVGTDWTEDDMLGGADSTPNDDVVAGQCRRDDMVLTGRKLNLRHDDVTGDAQSLMLLGTTGDATDEVFAHCLACLGGGGCRMSDTCFSVALSGRL